ncbi:hypothetical protein SH2C18_27520 [Clostridium sediminicola]|uniref:HAMP domain-containing protein n=1 Tax=Clostridium sediminicola TaxID=3114879 RepID=UPI0031F1FC87
MIILVSQFAFQYFKLEEYYVYNKKKTVTSTLNSLKDKIEKNMMEEDMIEASLKEASIESDIFVAIFDRYGVPQFGLNEEYNIPYLEIEDDINQSYKIYIDGFSNNEFIDSIGDNKRIEVKGVLFDYNQNKVYPDTISIDGKDYSYETNNTIDSTDYNLFGVFGDKEGIMITNGTGISLAEGIAIDIPDEVKLNGIITEINLTSEKDLSMEYRKSQLLQETFWFLGQQKNLNTLFSDNKVIQYSKEDNYTGMKNLVFAQPILFPNKEPMIIFALSSLQPIKETTEIMKSYFLFILLAAMLLAIIASYFYSKKITTPLLHLNDVTKTMANLDFSKKCEVQSKDEIVI